MTKLNRRKLLESLASLGILGKTRDQTNIDHCIEFYRDNESCLVIENVRYSSWWINQPRDHELSIKISNRAMDEIAAYNNSHEIPIEILRLSYKNGRFISSQNP